MNFDYGSQIQAPLYCSKHIQGLECDLLSRPAATHNKVLSYSQVGLKGVGWGLRCMTKVYLSVYATAYINTLALLCLKA